MVLSLYKYNGGLLKINGGLATSDSCCCASTCCCPQFDAVPLPDLTFVLAGYLSGSVQVEGNAAEECGVWGTPALLPLDADKCGGEFATNVSVSLNCTGAGVDNVVATLSGGGAACAIGDLELVSITCDNGAGKFEAVYNWTVVNLAGCTCTGETGTLTITEV